MLYAYYEGSFVSDLCRAIYAIGLHIEKNQQLLKRLLCVQLIQHESIIHYQTVFKIFRSSIKMNIIKSNLLYIHVKRHHRNMTEMI
jgi:hypothetical protein